VSRLMSVHDTQNLALSSGVLFHVFHVCSNMWTVSFSSVLFAPFQNERPALPKDMPREYSDIIQRCWQRDPRLRPDFCEILPTLREMHEALGPGPKVCADVTACADIPTVLEMKCSHAAFSTVVVRRVGRFRVVLFYCQHRRLSPGPFFDARTGEKRCDAAR
jgi:hypothetical protein